MQINLEAFLASLSIMGLGMLGIFTVTLIIIAAVTLLNRLTGNTP